MSGVTTSSLSIAWSLRNWVMLDYEEDNGLTIRPWAPFLLSFYLFFIMFPKAGQDIGCKHRNTCLSSWSVIGQVLLDRSYITNHVCSKGIFPNKDFKNEGVMSVKTKKKRKEIINTWKIKTCKNKYLKVKEENDHENQENRCCGSPGL